MNPSLEEVLGMEKITPELIQQKISAGRRYSLVLLKAGPRFKDETLAQKIQASHLKYLFELREQGTLLLNGPIFGNDELKGVGIYDLTDKDEVIRIVGLDPSVQEGRFVFEVFDWFGLPGDSLPLSS
jgi:uncharacterized protein YciI